MVEGGYQEFSREAKQYSVDSTVEKDIKKSEATLKYETETFNLTKGKISDIIEDGDSYYRCTVSTIILRTRQQRIKRIWLKRQRKQLLMNNTVNL